MVRDTEQVKSVRILHLEMHRQYFFYFIAIRRELKMYLRSGDVV